jgi:hypothetical protein
VTATELVARGKEPRRCFGAGLGVDLLEDVFEVRPHGVGRDPEALGDLRVRFAVRDRFQDLALAAGEGVQAVRDRAPLLAMTDEVWLQQSEQLARSFR